MKSQLLTVLVHLHPIGAKIQNQFVIRDLDRESFLSHITMLIVAFDRIGSALDVYCDSKPQSITRNLLK